MVATQIPTGPSVQEAKQLLEARRDKGWVELALRYGKNFTYQGILVTCDPDVIHSLLTQRSHTQVRSAAYKLAARIVPGAPGVLFMDGEEWRQHIQAVMPVFTHANIDGYSAVIHDIASSTIDCWTEGQRFGDLYETLTELGLKVVLRVGYGLDPADPLALEFGKALMDYKLATMRSRARLDEFGFSASQARQLPAFVAQTANLSRRMQRLRTIVRKIREQRRTQPARQSVDWFSALDKFPLPVLTNELNHIYGAFNAIDYALTCACYELSRHPDWAIAIRDELATVLNGRPYRTHEDFAALPKTTQFMREVFRCYPVAMAVARKTGEVLQVDGAKWPAGKEVFILIAALHYHPDLWDDPMTFKPERWAGQTPERGYIPFLMGPRKCVGQHLAELHFVITLNALLQRCQLEVQDQTVRIVPYMIPRFERAIPCVVRRSQSEKEQA